MRRSKRASCAPGHHFSSKYKIVSTMEALLSCTSSWKTLNIQVQCTGLVNVTVTSSVYLGMTKQWSLPLPSHPQIGQRTTKAICVGGVTWNVHCGELALLIIAHMHVENGHKFLQILTTLLANSCLLPALWINIGYRKYATLRRQERDSMICLCYLLFTP